MFYRFRFESETYREMSRLPVHLRMKLDLTGIKISLKDWLAFSYEERLRLCEAPVETGQEKTRFAAIVDSLLERHTGVGAVRVPPLTAAPWEDPRQIPPAMLDKGTARDRPVNPEEWSRWNPCQRYALIKLASSKNEPEKFYEALREFRQGGGESS